MPRGKRKSKEEEENVSTAKTTPVEKRTAKQTKTKGEKKSTSKTNPVVEESLQVADAASHDKQINNESKNAEVTKETKPTKPKMHKNRKKITTEDILSDIAIQYGDNETSVLEIVEKVKQDCKNKGYRKQVRRVSMYVKPEDGKVYYALDDTTDSVELFDESSQSE